ncbi:MAG: undecaprenyl-diphosphate phosphatase [Rhodopseudomonas palustris]|nr:undecaprenyl-diphosphate phosphatase [Rhodopseudomonas palustris]
MSYFQALFLALIQGLTEFLPVSSDGHLAFFGHILGLENPDIAFDILLHLATLAAVVGYYRKEILKLAIDLIKPGIDIDRRKDSARFALAVIIATVPTAIIGLSLKDSIESLHADLRWSAAGFLVTAVFLAIGARFSKERSKTTVPSLPLWIPFIIGIAQGLAVLPGVSRSGLTISTAMLFRAGGVEAAEFSFILSIPAILGAALLRVPGDLGDRHLLCLPVFFRPDPRRGTSCHPPAQSGSGKKTICLVLLLPDSHVGIIADTRLNPMTAELRKRARVPHSGLSPKERPARGYLLSRKCRMLPGFLSHQTPGK